MIWLLASCSWLSANDSEPERVNRHEQPRYEGSAPDFATLLVERTIVLRGRIDEQSATAVIASLLFLANQDPSAPIHLYIESPGGSLTESLAIYDTMDDVAPPIHTYCVGRAEGTALLLLAHGARGHRTATSHATLGFVDVRATTGEAGKDELERWRRLLVERFVSDTGQSEATVVRYVERAKTLSATEGTALGLVDRVVDQRRGG